ncbi:MAG: PAS domain-containing protein, partial [Xenococcaceae cyanobacterium]
MRYSLNEAIEKGMVLQLVDDSIQACNSNVEKILGITADRMEGWTSLDRCWHGEDGSIFESEEHPTVICLLTGTPQSNKIIGFDRSDGELIWLLLDAQPLFKANENLPYAVVTTFTDITQQKLAFSQFESTSESVSLPSNSEQKLRTILIVDDNAIDRETYRRYLRAERDCQYNILEAELGEEGLELCQQNLAKIDAILLDFFLPDLDGLEFLRSLQNFCQKIPVIVVTGQGDEAIAVELLKTGADDYLIKDRITTEQLRSTVNNVIQKEQLRIQIKQAEKERLQQVEKERLIFQISQSIRRSLKLEEILQSSVEEVKKFLESDRVVIFRLQPNGNGTVISESVNPQYQAILASSYYDPCFSENYTERFRQGLVTAKTDIYNSDINPCHIELLERFQVRANLVVPILQGENLWGLLIVHHCSAPRRWQQMEIDSLKELTIQLGIAIQQAELYKNLQIELSERQQAEKQARSSQQFIQQIADTMPGLLYIYDAIASENVYLNSQAFDLLGYTKEEIQTMGAQFMPQVMHPEDLTRLSEHFDRLNFFQSEDVLGFEYRMRHRDGHYCWFYSRDKIFSRTNDGKLHQILGVAQDISERKQAEENLRNSEEQVRLATNAAELGMWFWDLPKNSLVWTEKSKALFGISPETQMSYELFLDCLHPDDRDRTNDAVNRSLEDKNEYDIEYRSVWSDGSIHWITAKGRGFYDETGNPIKMMGTVQDITQRKQAEETLRRSEELNRRILDSSNDCIKVLDLQ